MRYIEPIRVKIMMIAFFIIGAIGIVVGLFAPFAASQTVMITFMGVVNIGLGAFFAFLFVTQIKKDPDKRKKKRKLD